MKWIGHPEKDPVLSLMDEGGATIIFGQIIRQLGGWRAHDYVSDSGNGKKLGLYLSQACAKEAVEISVRDILMNRSRSMGSTTL